LQHTFTILIADRNPNVRELLKRELAAEGYRIQLANSSREVLRCMEDASRRPHLLIVDPDLPDMDEISILDVMAGRAPDLPVVIHTFLADYIHHPTSLSSAPVVEKDGRHVDELKGIVHELLTRSYPRESQGEDKTLNPEF
jgi:DNA-binding NtrC family response regulator